MALINCPECGKEISDKVTTCPHCGYPFEQSNKEEDRGTVNNNDKKRTKYVKIIIGLVALVLISVSTIMIVQNLNPVSKFISLIKNEKRDAAVSLFDKKIKNDEENIDHAKEIIHKNIDDIYMQYYKNKLSYEDANTKLNIYDGYDISNSYVSSIKEKLDSLYSSRKAYNKAEEAVKSNDVETAIKKYNAVIKDDPNYADATAKVKKLRTDYKKQLEDEAANYATNKKYNEAITNIDQLISVLGSEDEFTELKEKYTKMKAEQYVRIKVLDKGTLPKDTSEWRFNDRVTFVFEIKNNSEKTITGVEGVLTANDLFGKEIISLEADFTGISIKPQKSYREDRLSFECNPYIDEHVKLYNTAFKDLQFQYNITSIVYSDGTKIKPE
jgi:Uncharacterised protein family UPF0547.